MELVAIISRARHFDCILTAKECFLLIFLNQVNRFGCIGGRKHNPNDNLNNREAILFKDITVSRRHFEVL